MLLMNRHRPFRRLYVVSFFFFFGRGMIIIQNTPQQLVLLLRLLPSLVNTCTSGLCNNTLRALCVCVLTVAVESAESSITL